MATINRQWMHAATLWLLCVVQPLYDLLSQHSTFFVARGSSYLAIVWMAVLLALAPFVLCGVLHFGTRRLPRSLRSSMWALLMILPSALLWSVLSNRADWTLSASMQTVLAVVVGLLCFLIYARVAVVQRILTIGVWSVCILPLCFLFASPMLSLFPSKAHAPQHSADSFDAVRSASRTPVIMLIWDELPLASLLRSPTEINADLFPNFAQLSREATWYTEASTVSSFTHVAVPAIVTGRYPQSVMNQNVATAADQTIFSLLHGIKDIHAAELYSMLCHASICSERSDPPLAFRDDLRSMMGDISVLWQSMVLPKSWQGHLPNISGVWANFHLMSQDDPRERVSRVIHDLRSVDLSDFIYAHFGVPHRPLGLLPNGAQYAGFDASLQGAQRILDGIGVSKRSAMVTEGAAAEAYQRHVFQVAYVDRALGAMVQSLKQAGMWDEALVIVTSDHGMYFGADADGRSLREPTPHSVDSIIRVPLFVKYPGQDAGVVDRQAAQTIDIVPTILDVLGLQAPRPLDGQPLQTERPLGADIPALALSPFEPYDIPRRAQWLDALLSQQAARFGAAPLSWNALWHGRSDPTMLGRAMHDFPVFQDRTRFAQIVMLDKVMNGEQSISEVFAAFDPTIYQSRVKAWIYGEPLSPDTVLALAVNGTIACTAPVVTELNGAQYFSCMVPPEQFSMPIARIDLARVQLGPEGKTLHSYPIRLGRVSQ